MHKITNYYNNSKLLLSELFSWLFDLVKQKP